MNARFFFVLLPLCLQLFAADVIYIGSEAAVAIDTLFLASNNATAAKHRTLVSFQHQQQYLLIHAKMHIDPDYVMPAISKQAGKWPPVESVELFFDHQANGKNYHQLAIGADGSLFDSRLAKKAWEPEWSCQVEHGKGFWSIDVKIPAKVKTGDRWGFNFCRNVKEREEYFSTWAKVGSRFHTPGRFGLLYFGSEKEVIEIENAAFEKEAAVLRQQILERGRQNEFAKLFSGRLSHSLLKNISEELEAIKAIEGN